MASARTNLVMTVIGFTISTTFIVFVCTRLIFARIRLSASRRSLQAAAATVDSSLLERGLQGLEPVTVASFPTMKYDDEFSSEQDTQCTICLAEYQEKDSLRVLPLCGHNFHVNCIDKWLQQHSTCPVCRLSLRDLAERKRMLPPMFSSMIRTPSGYLETYNSRLYRCVHIGHDHSNRTLYNHIMQPIEEGSNSINYHGAS